jgi:hypothetical protein
VQKPGARDCQLRYFYVKYLCSIYEISSCLRSNNIWASLGVNGDSIRRHLSATLVWNVRRISPSVVTTLQNNLSFVVSKEMKQKPTEYKRNRSFFFLAYLSDGLFFASSIFPQYLNIITFPLPQTLLQNFLQKIESVEKPAVAESLCVHRLLAGYNLMHYVYRNLQNRIKWGCQKCVCIQLHVIFSKIQERTQSQPCEF